MVNWRKKHGQTVRIRKRWQAGLVLVSIGMIFVSSPVHAGVRDTAPALIIQEERINQWVGANQPTKSILTAVPTLDVTSKRITPSRTTIQVKVSGVLTTNADITSCSIQLLDKDGQKVSSGIPENLTINGKSVYFDTRAQSAVSTRGFWGNLWNGFTNAVSNLWGNFTDGISTILYGPKNPWTQTLTMTGDLKLKIPVYVALVFTIQGREYKYALIRFAERTNNQTPLDLSVTGKLNKFSRSIRGRGRANAEIRSDVNDRRAAVDAQGNYTLDVGQDALLGKDLVRVTEVFNNEFRSIDAPVNNPYTIKANQVLFMSSNDITGLTKSTKPDVFTKNFSQYLKKAGGIEVAPIDQDSDPNFNADQMIYVATLTDSGKPTNMANPKDLLLDPLDAATLKKLQKGSVLKLTVYGINQANKMFTDSVRMDIQREDDQVDNPFLIWPQSLDFKNVTVPAHETLFRLREPPILGIHGLSPLSQCSVSVSVGPITSRQGEKFAGQLVYWDGTQQHALDQSYLLYQRGKFMKEDTVSISKDWYQSHNGQRGKGLYLAVQPNARLNNYSGTVTWTLNNVPAR